MWFAGAEIRIRLSTNPLFSQSLQKLICNHLLCLFSFFPTAIVGFLHVDAARFPPVDAGPLVTNRCTTTVGTGSVSTITLQLCTRSECILIPYTKYLLVPVCKFNESRRANWRLDPTRDQNVRRVVDYYQVGGWVSEGSTCCTPDLRYISGMLELLR